MIVLGIDPGEVSSGVVLYDSDARRVRYACAEFGNAGLCAPLEAGYLRGLEINAVVCEKAAAMGQPLSGNLVETILWSGAFWNSYAGPWNWMTRNQVKVAICGSCKGVKDAHVSAGVQERFGGRKAAIGRKKVPGPCYGVSSHCWQALAVVVAWLETEAEKVK